jgi:hypothetical protein
LCVLPIGIDLGGCGHEYKWSAISFQLLAFSEPA